MAPISIGAAVVILALLYLDAKRQTIRDRRGTEDRHGTPEPDRRAHDA